MPITWADKMDNVLKAGRDRFGRTVTYKRTGYTAFNLLGIPDRIPRLEDQNRSDFTSVSFRAADFIDAPFAASVTVTFTGNSQPQNGNTITLDGITYTYRTTINNLVAYEIARGANASQSAANLAAAINASLAGSGTQYSSATTAHPTCTAAVQVSGLEVLVTFTTPGPTGNGVKASENLNGANLSATEFNGGTPINGDLVTMDGLEWTVTDFGSDSEGLIQCRIRRLVANIIGS